MKKRRTLATISSFRRGGPPGSGTLLEAAVERQTRPFSLVFYIFHFKEVRQDSGFKRISILEKDFRKSCLTTDRVAEHNA
jgi:hypothetical protein